MSVGKKVHLIFYKVETFRFYVDEFRHILISAELCHIIFVSNKYTYSLLAIRDKHRNIIKELKLPSRICFTENQHRLLISHYARKM